MRSVAHFNTYFQKSYSGAKTGQNNRMQLTAGGAGREIGSLISAVADPKR
jgi:hypothetical protein